MTFISDLRTRLDSLGALPELDVAMEVLPSSADRLSDESLLASLATAATLANDIERLKVTLSGVAARRSARELGHSGLAAKKATGHRRR